MIIFIILAIYLLGLYPSYRIILHSDAKTSAEKWPDLLAAYGRPRISPVELAKQDGGNRMHILATIFWPVGLPEMIFLTKHCCWREPK